MSNNTNALQKVASVNVFLNTAATEAVLLSKHLDFVFLLEYDVFAPSSGANMSVQAIRPHLRLFHCYYKDIYGTHPVTREVQHSLVSYYCGLDNPSSRDTIDQFLIDMEHIVSDVFSRLVE